MTFSLLYALIIRTKVIWPDPAMTFGVESWRHCPHVSVNDHDIGDLALIQIPFSIGHSPTVRVDYHK